MNYKFTLKCVDGGYGWGKTGQEGYIVASASSLEEALKWAKLQVPGGWTIKFDCMTDLNPCLNSNINLI